jgi:hypothetical protein
MSGMAGAVKRSEHEQFAKSVGAVASSVTGLVECTAQAAYLVSHYLISFHHHHQLVIFHEEQSRRVLHSVHVP